MWWSTEAGGAVNQAFGLNGAAGSKIWLSAVAVVCSAALSAVTSLGSIGEAGCSAPPPTPRSQGVRRDDSHTLPAATAEARLGDRLFFETRFAHFFSEHCSPDVNAPCTSSDPLVNRVPVAGGAALLGPFRGQAMNCRQCHLAGC